MAITRVQGTEASGSLTLPSAPTSGNLLVIQVGGRSTNGSELTVPSGWSAHPDVTTHDHPTTGDSISTIYKISDGSEQTINVSGQKCVYREWSGVGTAGAAFGSVSAGAVPGSGTVTTGAVVPTAGSRCLVIGGAVVRTADTFAYSFAPTTGWTEDYDSSPIDVNHPKFTSLYQVVESASGTYNPTTVLNVPESQAYAGQTLVFYESVGTAVGDAADPMPGVWVNWGYAGGTPNWDDGVVTSSDGRLARMLPEAGSLASGGDNITADVVSIEWSRGAASDHVSQPPVGVCTITVKNGATAAEPGKYTPDNTGSTLYGKLRPGLPVWIGRNTDGTLSGTGQTVHGVWAGYVRQIVPIPVTGAAETPTAQIICEDPLGYFSRQKTSVVASTTRSVEDLRDAVLDDIGVPSGQRDLASETNTMQLSSADSTSALRVLEEINSATGSRHLIEPGDTKEDWYFYRTVTRQHKLTAANDFDLNADDIQATAGYRVTEENVINYQEVETPDVRFQPGLETVWTAAVPVLVSTLRPTVLIASFDDFVKSATMAITSTGGTLTSSFTSLGDSGVIELIASGSDVTVTSLIVQGYPVVRSDTARVKAEDATSQMAYGLRAGASISSPYVGAPALGQGLADFLVWKFKAAHPRMSITVTNLFATLNGRTLYDTLALTFDRLHLSGRRMEIIGEQGSCDMAVVSGPIHWTTTYELQETPNQSALALFTLNASTLNGSDVLGY